MRPDAYAEQDAERWTEALDVRAAWARGQNEAADERRQAEEIERKQEELARRLEGRAPAA
jgi:hypothetical protein